MTIDEEDGFDSTNSYNINSSSSMNVSIISHRQGHSNHDTRNNSNNSHSNTNIEEVTVEEDRYWFSSSSSSPSASSSISCLSLSLVSRLIKRCFIVIGRAGSSSLFFWLALICGILTFSNVQRSFRTTIETETRVMVNNMNMNGNNATAAQQQGRLLNRTNTNTTAAPTTRQILPKTKVIYYPTILPTTHSPVNATTAATTVATTTENNKDENDKPAPSSSSSTRIIIDPTSLKRGIDLFLRSHNNYDTTTTTTTTDNKSRNNYIWDLLENYQTYHTHTHHNRTTTHNHNHNYSHSNDDGDHYYYYEHDEISSEMICGIGPGRGMEQDAGYKLLVEKVRISIDIEPTDNNNNNNDMPDDDSNESQHQQQQPQHEPPPKPKPNTNKPKILCLVYTYSPMRYLVRTQAILWGRQCDGYIAFSNETIPELGIYKLPTNTEYSEEEVEESYQNMWQKTRRIWKYVHDHFVEDYDYFYISGDDVYLLVNNFRSYIQNELELLVSDSIASVPRHFGSWLPSKSMIAGGPGYTLNKAALQQFFEITTTTTVDGKGSSSSSSSNTSAVWNNCLSNKHASYEDRFMSYCMSTFLGIHGNDTDTRDPTTGEQKFHDTDPATLYLFRSSSNNKKGSSSYFSRMASSWEDQPMPQQQKQQQPPQNHVEQEQIVVGPKHELDAAAKYSISLHRIYTPTYMARIHAILHHHPTTSTSTSIAICPIDTPLGKGLQRHYLH